MKDRIILDLCGGTGAWSKPYKDAGYTVINVTHPLNDVFTYHPPKNVYGVLAAPPCTMFSMARTNAKTPRDLRGAMDIVNACIRIIQECQYDGKRLKFWALENPKARLRWFLGKPVMTFNPYQFGDRYRKPTDIWGNFNEELKETFVELTEKEKERAIGNNRRLEDLPEDYILPDNFSARAARRSITPAGFAQAFFKANK